MKSPGSKDCVVEVVETATSCMGVSSERAFLCRRENPNREEELGIQSFCPGPFLPGCCALLHVPLIVRRIGERQKKRKENRTAKPKKRIAKATLYCDSSCLARKCNPNFHPGPSRNEEMRWSECVTELAVALVWCWYPENIRTPDREKKQNQTLARCTEETQEPVCLWRDDKCCCVPEPAPWYAKRRCAFDM